MAPLMKAARDLFGEPSPAPTLVFTGATVGGRRVESLSIAGCVLALAEAAQHDATVCVTLQVRHDRWFVYADQQAMDRDLARPVGDTSHEWFAVMVSEVLA